MSVDELREQLDAFESRYDVPSERMVDAFRNWRGQVRETDDLLTWQVLYDAWKSVRSNGSSPHDG